MDQREVALAEAALRRSLASLEEIAVPTLGALGARRASLPRLRALFAPLATALAVVITALAIGSGLAAWRADRTATVAASGSPGATANARTATPFPSDNATVTLPTDCPPGTLPDLKNDVYPQGNEHGGATPSAAFAATYPTAGPPAVYKFGNSVGAPVWIVAGGHTYIATILPDGSWFVSPSTFVGCDPLPEQRYFDIDGYRFTVTIVRDARYGPNTSAGASYVSAVAGIGVRCEWTRTGPDIAKLTDVWGTRDNVVITAGYSPVPIGAHGDRTNGVPRDAVQGGAVTMTCGVSDDSGGHGVYIDIALGTTGDYRAGSVSLTRWSGVVGDTLAAVACKGRAGTATLIAAFTSTAGEVADWIENAAYPNAPQVRGSAFRTSYAPGAPIYVCYFSGSWAPPVGPVGLAGPVGVPAPTERPIDYDRARYFIDANGNIVPPSTIGSSGPSSYLPLVRPGGRF